MVKRIFYKDRTPGIPKQAKPEQQLGNRILLHPRVSKYRSPKGDMYDLLRDVKSDNESILQLMEQCNQLNVDGK